MKLLHMMVDFARLVTAHDNNLRKLLFGACLRIFANYSKLPALSGAFAAGSNRGGDDSGCSNPEDHHCQRIVMNIPLQHIRR